MPTIQFSVVGVPCSSLAFRAFPIVLEQVGNEARSVTQGMKPCQRTVEWIAPSTVMGSKFCVWPVRPLLPLMFAYEFNECRSVRLPIHREAIEVFEDCIDAGLFKESDCVFGVFIEVSIEYPLVHEIRVAADVEEDPSQVVELEWGENKRIDKALLARIRGVEVLSSLDLEAIPFRYVREILAIATGSSPSGKGGPYVAPRRSILRRWINGRPILASAEFSDTVVFRSRNGKSRNLLRPAESRVTRTATRPRYLGLE